MKLLVATDAHIFKTQDGRYWSKAIYDYSFWKRYLDVFSSVKVVARVKKVESDVTGLSRMDGKGVEVHEIPFYQGPKQLASKFLEIHKALYKVGEDCDCALFRMPSQTAQMTYQHWRKSKPFAGEIVYNPMDDVNNQEAGFFNRIINRIISRNLKRFCANANGVSYVTEKAIQRYYPCRAMYEQNNDLFFTAVYSTITLGENAFLGPRKFEDKKELCLVLSDVAMNSDRKGERVLLDVLASVRKKGYDYRAIIIGDGSKRCEYENYARNLGIEEKVEFTGLLSSAEAVREKLKEADIFFFPTQGEGLPRGVIESMAAGLPVLTTPVGGIPEVIAKEFLFEPHDVYGFANKLMYLYDNRIELNKMSLDNYNCSKKFANANLQKIRNSFYLKLKEIASKAK